ncbi:NAD-dependent epimerase [Paenibacillus sp. FJAT-26967]|uniref:NAD-dependent epimerase n=1 Tax=Paenibacillus sp. FJAT-26967 TaxID=1729690 RepID=UPI0008383FD1|nr:NAD-dependent epimerase [Paenibacillus sp. FJAT-26967]
MILITGAAGFIGAHLSRRLMQDGYDVIGVDNLNEYYDVQLKRDRLKWLQSENFKFHELGLENGTELNAVFEQYNPRIVINLAAQAGVRYSLENPSAYISSNITGFTNILEACRHYKVDHLIYASSSSVYGANKKIPFAVTDNVDHPVSLYAATKKSNELMAHTYSHLFGLPTTGLRFFTVYGPWGRPDMAYFSFTGKILAGKPIQIFNHGEMRRDFTYIDDIVEGIVRLIDCPPANRLESELSSSTAPYKIYNIGNNQPVELMKFVRILEQHLDRKAVMELLPMQPGDVKETFADIEELKKDTGFSPSTSLEQGLRNFVSWYLDYYQINEPAVSAKTNDGR